MKSRIAAVFMIMEIVLGTVQYVKAQGTVYLSNLGQSSAGSVALGSDSWLAAGIETANNPSGYMLNSVKIAVIGASGAPNGFTAMVYSQSSTIGGGVSPGSSLETLMGSASPSMTGTYTYSDVSNLILAPNSIYFIVLTSETTVANGAYKWSVSGTYAYNQAPGWAVANDEGNVGTYFLSGNGTSWGASQGNLQFALNATPLPEPSAWSIILLGGGFFVYGRRTRKH